MPLTITKYTNTASLYGGSRATLEGVCLDSEWLSIRNTLLGSPDSYDPTLRCTEVTRSHHNGDPGTDMSQLVATYTPREEEDPTELDGPMLPSLNFGSEMFTVKGPQWTWLSDGKLIDPDQVQPVKILQVAELTLHGRRSVMNWSTFDAYLNSVNSDTFFGAPPGTVRFDSPAAQKVALPTGGYAWDVELKFKRRSIPWNQVWRPGVMSPGGGYDTGKWDEVTNGTERIYTLVNYDPLLLPV
jgi:hypothetical protein